MQKAYANLPPFRPIINITSTYYNIGRFVSCLLQPLTNSDYNLKDSFYAVIRIRSILPKLSEEDYSFFHLMPNHYLQISLLRRQPTSVQTRLAIRN